MVNSYNQRGKNAKQLQINNKALLAEMKERYA